MFTVQDCQCPKCLAVEMHPDGDKVLIRGFKVTDEKGRIWSQCLVCSGYYSVRFNIRTRRNEYVINEKRHNPNKGWF